MKRKDFKKTMYSSKVALHGDHRYCCPLLASKSKCGYYDFKDTPIVKLYKEIINGVDDSCYGMFGRTYICNTEGHAARQLSLEIFEKVVLEEKLYLKL